MRGRQVSAETEARLSYGRNWVMTVFGKRRIEAGDEPARTSHQGRYAMSEDNKVVPFRQPDAIDDPLIAILRAGARRLLEQGIEAEVKTFLAAMNDLKLPDGRVRLVRHGHGPERSILTGIGAVAFRRAKVCDRGAGGDEDRIRFTSAILPTWVRRTKSLDALLPVLYLRGISSGDFQEALSTLLGKDAPNLSPSVIGRLKEEWAVDYARWRSRDLSARRYVYIWVDGVYLQARMEPTAECILVMIGATGVDRLPGRRAADHR